MTRLQGVYRGANDTLYVMLHPKDQPQVVHVTDVRTRTSVMMSAAVVAESLRCEALHRTFLWLLTPTELEQVEETLFPRGYT